MGNSTKIQHLREKMLAASKQSKQTTLDNLRDTPKKAHTKAVESGQKKQIIITEIDTVTKEDELALKVEFRLLPSKTAFSKIRSARARKKNERMFNANLTATKKRMLRRRKIRRYTRTL